MALPVLETNTFELTLPSSDVKVKYRPFLVKEEKILLQAMESQEQKQIVQAVKSGDAKKAQNLHGLANLSAYFGAKAGGMGILFINVKGGTATTSYAESLEQLLQAFDVKVDTAYPISTVPLNPFPKIGVTAKK